MTLTLNNIRPAQNLGKTGDINFPYSEPFSVVDYIKDSFVEPIKQPIDPNLPMVIQENGVDIDTEAIANAVAFALYENDSTAISDITDFYKQTIYEMSNLPPLHPNKWLIDWARERVNRRSPFPRPNQFVKYTVDSDIIPECKDFISGIPNSDNVAASFSYVFDINALGIAFRMDNDFNKFQQQFKELVEKEKPNLTSDTLKQCDEFLKMQLSKLTLDIAVRNEPLSDNNEPYSFAQLLRYTVDNYVNSVPHEAFYIPFQTKEMFVPTSIIFINLEKHAHSNKNNVLKHWEEIEKALNSPVKLWSKKSIKKLQQVATMNSRNSNVIRSLEKQKHDNTQRLNTPISLTAPSTIILQKRIAKVIKKTTDVNRSMNAYKTRKRSFARPNRREPENIDRSGVVISTKYRPDIHIYQDTSGSISEENYEAATRMLIDIAIRLDVDLYYTSFSHIISRPTKVRVKGRSKEAIYNSIKKIPKVGGGTDFKNVWDIINQNPQRQKQIGFIISDMEYWAPTVETKIPTNLYYLPIANISWQAIQRMTRNFLDSTKHYKQNIRRNILY